MSGWTDHRTSELRRLWDAGASCSAIGEAIGVSRAAVSGMARRLGLSRRGSPLASMDRDATAMARLMDLLAEGVELPAAAAVMGIEQLTAETMLSRACDDLGPQGA